MRHADLQRRHSLCSRNLRLKYRCCSRCAGKAALAIVSDDENPATVIAAMRSGAQGYFGKSMPPELALQALSFVLHGGTYFSPAAIMASQALGGGFRPKAGNITSSRSNRSRTLERHDQAPPLGPDDSNLRTASLHPFRCKATNLGLGHGTNGVRPAPSLPSGNTPFLPAFASATPTR